MGALKGLERVEDVGWRFLRARFHQVLRPPASQASYVWQVKAEPTYAHGPKQPNKQSLLHGQQIWRKCGTGHGITLLPIKSFFGAHLASGTFFCGTKRFSTKRGLATQGDFDDGDDLEVDVSESDASDLSSDEDTIDKDPNRKKQHRTASQMHAHHEAEEDIDLADAEGMDDELRVSSLLDSAVDKSTDETGDQARPLWMRLEEASVKKSTLQDVFDAWTAEGNPLCRAVIIFTITVLRKRRKFWRALEVSDWVLTQKLYELTDMDYGIRVELIAKVQGAHKAADYFATIPKVFQTSMAYSILLTAYVEQNKEKEAVSLLQKVEKLGLGHRTYMYNQLLFLYKKNGLMAGVAEVLQTMDQKNVEPDIYTYNIILDVRARKGDADGMEKVWARVKEDMNVEPDAATFAILAKGYITAGLYEKAEKVMKQVEHSPFRRRRVVNLLLLKLYGQLGKEEELERVWGLVTQGQKIGIADYVAMIRSLGKVGNASRAEDIFEDMVEKVDNLSVHHYNALLSVYASLGRTQKGESLLKQIAKASLNPNAATYHELVLMYLKAGQEHKAMEVLSKAQKASLSSIRRRPLYASFQAALEWFAEKGDVKNAEKVVRDLKNAGYLCAYRSYIVLLKAYENGHMSPYGFLDRIRADNVIPNQLIRKELKRLDGT
eukprot:c17453_g1_i1 orf=151-2136(+)